MVIAAPALVAMYAGTATSAPVIDFDVLAFEEVGARATNVVVREGTLVKMRAIATGRPLS